MLNNFKKKRIDSDATHSDNSNLETNFNSEVNKPQQSFIFENHEKANDPEIEKKK